MYGGYPNNLQTQQGSGLYISGQGIAFCFNIMCNWPYALFIAI